MDPIFAKYGGNRGALIPILQNAQELYNYLPKEVLQLIARQLG
ncbi:MAG: NAD(P)H-dependent oxidoreductase subunit E, partial [Anaerolineae bacterium]|nr:NAD(P)H-dependent oxidoreductase subunit E [Anaerolineae bacterium]